MPDKLHAKDVCVKANDTEQDKIGKLIDMVEIGMNYVRHFGKRIPTAADDTAEIKESLRADLAQFVEATFESICAKHKIKYRAKVSERQCAWMLYRFPRTPTKVAKRMRRAEADLLREYRAMITHDQCTRLQWDFVEFFKGGVKTSDVMKEGSCPLQENILAILHRSADAHNDAKFEGVKFTVADAVWLSLHANDDGNPTTDAHFARLLSAVRVHCKRDYDATADRKAYQQSISGCKTPGQLLRGSTAPLDMPSGKYPYSKRPLFPEQSCEGWDLTDIEAKEVTIKEELVKPVPRPYEAVLQLWYEANCNLKVKNSQYPLTGNADVLFPTRRPWKLSRQRGLAIRLAHARALKEKWPRHWHLYRDQVPVRVWMQVPMCVSSVYYFKYLKTIARAVPHADTRKLGEPTFTCPGLPLVLSDGMTGALQNPSNACYMNSTFQVLLRSKLGPRMMQSVQELMRAYLAQLRSWWDLQETSVQLEIKKCAGRIVTENVNFGRGIPKLHEYQMWLLFVIDLYKDNIQEGCTRKYLETFTRKRVRKDVTKREEQADCKLAGNYIIKIAKDGNCFFTSIAAALHPNAPEQWPAEQASLRRRLIEYMRTNHVNNTNTNEAWFAKMSIDREWADDNAIIGMSAMLNICIRVYLSTEGVFKPHNYIYGLMLPAPTQTVEMFAYGRFHYDLLIPPVACGAVCPMQSDNKNHEVYEDINKQDIMAKLREDRIDKKWKLFIFFLAMHEMSEVYSAAQTQIVVPAMNLFHLLALEKQDSREDIFDYHSAREAEEVLIAVATRTENFRSAICPPCVSLDTLIRLSEIEIMTCKSCNSIGKIDNIYYVKYIELPRELDGTRRDLQSLMKYQQDTRTTQCEKCDFMGVPAKDGINYEKFYDRTEIFGDFAFFYLSVINDGPPDAPHIVVNPNIANLEITKTLKLYCEDKCESEYKLIAVVTHSPGHYTAHVKVKGVWIYYNDHHAIATSSFERAVGCADGWSPHILLYEKSTRAPRVTRYVELPWDGPPDQWQAMQALLPRWNDGASLREEQREMWKFMDRHPNLAQIYKDMTNDEEKKAFWVTFKRMIDEARHAKERFGAAKLARLTMGDTCEVSLTAAQILTLMSCAFFDFFPFSDPKASEHLGLQYILRGKTNYLKDKSMCLWNYFRRAFAHPETRQVVFRRRNATFPDGAWTSSALHTKDVTWHDKVSGTATRIEDVCDRKDDQMWEVDFANASIGGGVLTDGCVQEEIRFMQCPELLVSILLTDRLEADESIQITGYRQFNETRGYGRLDAPVRFRYHGASVKHPTHARRMLVMDAVRYGEDRKADQFRWRDIKRELDKACCAFTTGTDDAICTGHWGCGAFGGNHRLKAVIQVLAAAMCGKHLEYCNFGDARGGAIQALLAQIPAGVAVSELYTRLKQGAEAREKQPGYFKTDANIDAFFTELVANLKAAGADA